MNANQEFFDDGYGRRSLFGRFLNGFTRIWIECREANGGGDNSISHNCIVGLIVGST